MLSPEAQLQGMAHPARRFDQRSQHGLDRGGGDPWGRRCADRHEMSRTPPSAGELVDILRSRHAVVMAGRPDERRGQFTELANHCRSDPYAIRPVGDQTRRRSDP